VETSDYFSELDSRDSRQISRVKVKSTFVQTFQLLLAFGAAFAIAMLLTTSLEISLAVSLLVTTIPFFVAKRGVEKSNRARELAWPSAIDSLVSSLQAGESITEAVQNLASHGPEELAPAFARVKSKMEGGESLEVSLLSEMRALDSSASDQTLSTLLIAKEFGGRDVTVTLRLLSSFLRDDFEAQEEIKTKFGWIRNSALLGAAAPWLILLLLSAQKDTVAAYQSSAGKTVLSIGVIATAVAFLWMERVARMPEAARPLRI
jgi:tight adherence protein B